MSPIIAYTIIILIIVGIVSALISLYNRLVMLRFNVGKAFANIDVLLKQRADEIPNLIQVVKESMKYESAQLEKLTKLRTDFMHSNDPDQKVKLSNDISQAVRSIFAVSENYPDLKASANFQNLQNRVSTIEDAIADRREFFNESVNMYNIGIHEFPNMILAGLMGYKDKPLLQITEDEKKYDGIKF